jgi:hypothetical protein
VKITRDDDIFIASTSLNSSSGCTALIADIVKQKPYYDVFRSNNFASDAAMVNFEQVFATYNQNTTRRLL